MSVNCVSPIVSEVIIFLSDDKKLLRSLCAICWTDSLVYRDCRGSINFVARYLNYKERGEGGTDMSHLEFRHYGLSRVLTDETFDSSRTVR